MRKPVSPLSSIVEIEVDELFGTYSYRLIPDDTNVSQILLLYGSNGSGKTTLLQLLFHLLSRASGKGHMTYLANTKFRRFAIKFANGTSLVAARNQKDGLVGKFTISAIAVDGKKTSYNVAVSSDGTVPKSDSVIEQANNVRDLCTPLAPVVYFVSDGRALLCDEIDSNEISSFEELESLSPRRYSSSILGREVRYNVYRDFPLEKSIERAVTWIRQQSIRASSAGDISTSTIYSEIVKRISTSSGKSVENDKRRLREVIESLNELADISSKYAELGLAQPVDPELFTKHIDIADESKAELLAGVLEPFVDSIRSRLIATAGLQEKLSSFLKIINDLFLRKTLTISVEEGFRVHDSKGDPLSITMLSSGERQLLLLLSNVLVSTGTPSIVLIDEPELSLNIKWQRQLIDVLLSLVKGSQVQFLMATHSLELLNRYRHNVLQLDDTGGDS